MPGVPQTDAAHLPAAQHLTKRSARAEECLSGSKRKFVNQVDRDVVPNIEDARPFVTFQTINVFRSIGFATSD